MSNSRENGHGSSKLGWFLCWAVVFADIGTSLYYVPGILFGDVGNLAGLFVLMSSVVFVLLVLKYIEITERYPEGGGVVTVATSAFGPWFGALGGMFITVDYFLTASISSVSGFAYLNSIIEIGAVGILIAAALGLFLLGVLNVIGIKESAKVTAVVAVAAFIVDIVLVGFVITQVGPEGWQTVFNSLGQVSTLSPWAILTGFAGSFLAFSGLESISQLSPAMQTPRKKVASIAMGLVVVAIFVTSPFLTLFSTNLLTAKIPGTEEVILESVQKIKPREYELAEVNKHLTENTLPENKTREELVAEKSELEKQISEGKEYSERFMSELGAQYGGPLLKIAVVATASVLLLFASNTAIIGAYHVFISLSRQRFLPQVLQKHNLKFDSPHWAVLLAVAPPIVIVFATRGDLTLLGQLYAFGLLGAFTLTSLGLDVVRWRENRKITATMVFGVITTILVAIAWGVNLYNKQLATVFGGGITIVGMIIAYFVRKYTPESAIEHVEVVVEKATNVTKGQILVPVFDEFDGKLFRFAAAQAKALDKAVVVMYIREFADILQTVSESVDKDPEAAEFLSKAEAILKTEGIKTEILYASGSNTAGIINQVRSASQPTITIMSPHKQSTVLDFLKGRILEDVISHNNGNVLIYTGNQKG